MPNLPARIGKGLSWLVKGNFADNHDLSLAQNLFDRVGKTLIIDEGMINDATAVSGSGPGFLCDLIEGKSPEEIETFAEITFMPALEATAANLGFTAQQAKILAELTTKGTVEYLENQRLSPEQVREQIASKGGTTEAGLKKLRHDIANLPEAALAAKKRAEELSKKE